MDTKFHCHWVDDNENHVRISFSIFFSYDTFSLFLVTVSGIGIKFYSVVVAYNDDRGYLHQVQSYHPLSDASFSQNLPWQRHRLIHSPNAMALEYVSYDNQNAAYIKMGSCAKKANIYRICLIVVDIGGTIQTNVADLTWPCERKVDHSSLIFSQSPFKPE